MKKYLVLGTVTVAILLVGGGAAYMALAQTSSTQVTACARPNGDVYLIGPNFSRQNCSGQQVEISWPTLVGVPKKLSYYDANNNYLGYVVRGGKAFGAGYLHYTAYNEEFGLFLDYDGDLLTSGLGLAIGSYTSDNFTGRRFTGNDCTGSSYFDEGIIFQPESLVSIDGVIYRGSSSSEPFEHRSTLNGGTCVNVAPTQVSGFRMVEVNLPGYLVSPANPIRVVETQF